MEVMEDRQARLDKARANESFPVRLARSAVERYVRGREMVDPPEDVPGPFRRRAGVFVSIHKDGMLRGCIGTTGPTCSAAAGEIIQNAISAATQDPRFRPVTRELPFLDYSVDVLSGRRKFRGAWIKGLRVIVERGGQGLLLPDLPGSTLSGAGGLSRRQA